MTPFEWPELGLAGLRQTRGERPVLALHGWLDNARSHAPLAPYLDGIDLVALEFPGHGRSRPRPEGVRYHFDDYVFDVLAAADRLGWSDFHLLGHSLGGAVACLTAAACPERVRSLVLIEGLGPISAPPDRAAAGWRQARRGSHLRPRRQHPTPASAVAARARNSDLDERCAELLAERGLVEQDGGFVWGHDLRLTWPSTQRYTEAQVLDLIAAIECPVMNLYSDPPSGLVPARLLQRRLAALRKGQWRAFPGGHHLHMHHPDQLGPVIQEFFDV
ncbi:alpha/beta fold hydrolase [Wenzhouxiangella marina]|uniref:Hydrolase n=1 Tax=Wenzhouxiangella marina TaxID=1579979 RepID=A0A0K0XSE8_9GAMM|nr:alpha/beta fold hydrolase [Wenzhouxiangella marina]AKS40547.1 hydrolase [Wenzhouxiangella marina]MBB6088315.1 pimeloyl-ACP methyl ester carboxylesterase [Wenzhouxiangella marina]